MRGLGCEFSTVQVQMTAFNTGMSCSICFQDVVGCPMLDMLWLVTGYFQSVCLGMGTGTQRKLLQTQSHPQQMFLGLLLRYMY